MTNNGFERRRVMFVHHGGGIGGAPVSMLDLASGLDPLRFDPLIVFTDDGPIHEYARARGLTSRTVPIRSAFFYSAHARLTARSLLSFAATFPSSVRAARAAIREWKPDLIVLNTSVLLPVARAAKAEGVPIVWHVREVPGPRKAIRDRHLAFIERHADRIVANSHFVRAFFSDGRSTVVHNGIEADAFTRAAARRESVRTELGIPADAVVVGMIGSVQKEKGHLVFVEAARRVAAEVPNARFLIVAGAPEVPAWKQIAKRALRMPLHNLEGLRQVAREAGLLDRFVFVGFYADMSGIMSALDVVAFLSIVPEGFGRPIVEAMAAGRPVVATDIGPSLEILGEGAGLLVPSGDSDAVASAVIRLLKDPAERERMGRTGRCRAVSSFSLEMTHRMAERVYDDVLSERGMPSRCQEC